MNKETLEKERVDWRERHPLLVARKEGRGFVCFHTNHLTVQNIEQAILENRSIEIDLQEVGPELGQYEKTDFLVSHHPFSYLKWYGNPIPTAENSLRVDDVVDKVKGQNMMVKIDLKMGTRTSLDKAAEIGKKLNPELTIVHAFVEELHASQFKGVAKPDKQDEAQTGAELVSLRDLKKLKRRMGDVPVQVSCRGFAVKDLNNALLDEMCQRVKGVAEVINLNLMYGQEVPKEERKMPHGIIKYIWEKHGLMVELNLDAGETAPEGIPFLGRSDKMERTTIIS